MFSQFGGSAGGFCLPSPTWTRSIRSVGFRVRPGKWDVDRIILGHRTAGRDLGYSSSGLSRTCRSSGLPWPWPPSRRDHGDASHDGHRWSSRRVHGRSLVPAGGQGRTEHPKPTRHDGHPGARLLPPRHGLADDLGPQGRHPSVRKDIRVQRLDVGPGRAPGRRPPVVVGGHPPLQQLANRQERYGTTDRPVLGELGGEFTPARFGVLECSVEPE